MHRTESTGVVGVLVSAVLTSTAAGQTFDWSNAAGGTYSTGANWTPVGPPGPGATARLSLPNTYNITFSASATVSILTQTQGSATLLLNGFTFQPTNTVSNGMGSGAVTSSLRIASGTFLPGSFSVGGNADSNSTLTLDDGSTTIVGGGTFHVGTSGNGHVNIQGGADLTTSASTGLGLNASGVGSATVTGSGSTWTVNNTLRVGASGTGTLNVQNGGAVTVNALEIGENFNSVGAVGVAGAHAVLTSSGTVNIGGSFALSPAAAATLNIDPGAAVTFNGTTNLRTTSTLNMSGGTLNLGILNVADGADTNWSAGTIHFADSASITPDMLGFLLDGTHVLGNNRTLAGATGTMQLTAPLAVNGGTLDVENLEIDAGLSIGAFGTVTAADTLVIDPGQTVEIENFGEMRAVTFGHNNGGTLILNGPNAQVTGFFANNFGVVEGTGRFSGGMNNGTGGTIRANEGDHLIIEEVGLTNPGIIELNGGTVEYTRTLSNLANGFLTGRGTFRGGTQTPGSNGVSNIGLMAFTSDTTDIYGDVINSGTGKIVAAGARVLTFFDDVTHNGVEIRTNDGSRSVFFGNLTGAGPFTGTGVVEFNGDLRPGNSPGLVTFGGDVLLSPASALKIELGGLLPGSQHDRIQVAGELLLGGRLDVTLINGFMPSTGDTFDVMNWGALDGMFTQIALPALTGSLHWDVSNLYVDGTIIVVADCPTDIVPTSGDGVVDVNDLLAVIVAWGACPSPCSPVICVADIAPPAGDCVVDVGDLLAIITTWGPCR